VKNLIIAKRYAKALFHLAKQEGKIEQYGEELTGLVQIFESTPELADAIQSPLYPEAARKSIFVSIAASVGLTPIMKSLVNLLIEKNRVTNLGEISEYYRGLIDEHANVARAKVSAAVPLSDTVVQEIASTLEKMTGKKIVVEFQQDPELIGGVVARIGDLVLDGSVRTQLFNIRETLKRGELG
jgi:F-type H+-transporting ATPase subunit delta